MKSKRYICIHSHFYQPPRENPWLEAIDYQESASPFHDWNERVNFECYRPNGRSRILDDQGRVARLTNNYARINFNFGPTLLSWMEDHDPETYQAILDGDKRSQENFGGHGSAIAQAYNHIILPLANRRDRETQVKWGLRDFEKRFGRAAEALWLPETAADLETLEILADHGMKYVILAPHQALQGVDSRHPHIINLPRGKSIAAFFYDGGLSRAVAFEGLLNNGETFARRLIDAFDNRQESQLLHIATDGESYGHHHRHGDMALAYALDYIGKRNDVTLTNYGQYLEKFPPQHEARIHERSSWSCVHGVERWHKDCGCNTGMRPGWQQKWRGPLREAIDRLRDDIAGPFETLMSAYTDNPWAMRNDYIEVILDRSSQIHEDFFGRWLKKDIDYKQTGTEQEILKALEMQRNLLLSYTSCAWFFDEISGTEAVQNLLYAARALELAQEIFRLELEDRFVEKLESAPSNIPEFGDGGYIFRHFAAPARVNFSKAATHVASSALFREKLKDGRLYCFEYRWKDVTRLYSGKSQSICAHIEMISVITRETVDIEFVAIHLGDHNINVGALPYGERSYKEMSDEFSQSFGHGDVVKTLRTLDKYFGDNIYSLNDLFRDQRKEIVDIVFSHTLESVEEEFQTLYQMHSPIMRYFFDINVALPPVFSDIARGALGGRIRNALEKSTVDVDAVRLALEEARKWNIELDAVRIESYYAAALKRAFHGIESSLNAESLTYFSDLLTLRKIFPFAVDLSNIQGIFAAWLFNRTSEIVSTPALEELLMLAAENLTIAFDRRDKVS